MTVLHFYRHPGASESQALGKLKRKFPHVTDVKTEYCYNIDIGHNILTKEQENKLFWLLRETFEPNQFSNTPFLSLPKEKNGHHTQLLEVGARLAFSTAFSSNSLSMFKACGIDSVTRVERSRRYLISSSTHESIPTLAQDLHDRMTECIYEEPLQSFDNHILPQPVKTIQLLEGGKKVLEALNKDQGLGFDDWDLDFYYNMFVNTLKRNPTDVECFDLGQSNSEHSRHWFFGGKMIIDGTEKKETLFSMVKSTLPKNSNSVIAFHDNSSAIRGFEVDVLRPHNPVTSSSLDKTTITLHPILTAETHNFPSGVAPFPGAETGTGGRLRDVQATGRGANTLAGVCGYCVGSLNIPDHPLPWEKEASTFAYPSNLAHPLDIKIEASNGASDYGNKFGEPVVLGYTRSYGQTIHTIDEYGKSHPVERREWIKPIMFTAGIGMLDERHSEKLPPEPEMVVCKIGGPAYRIGMGGGAASSRVQGTADVSLDFNAVQRGDAEMENRMNRVVRACSELGGNNPIVSIHDQGAGGNGNVLKEIVEPLGARYDITKIPLGDPTLSVMEIWGAEYQENDAILVRPQDLSTVQDIGTRENCPISPVGTVTGDGNVVVVDKDGNEPFNMPLSLVLGKMPQKSFTFQTVTQLTPPLQLPHDTTVLSALHRVLALLDVGSKRYLTNKVDRSVTGLVAQQQCVGPLHTPLSNVAVLAQSFLSITGVAVAIGEQPIKGLINNAAQARMTVGEAMTNMMWANITALSDIKASCNWMWASKLHGEGPRMWDACEALRDLLVYLGVGIDGGKDSLSMAAQVNGETVKCPGEVTFTCYAGVPDIRLTVTPDLKYPDQSHLLYIDLGDGYHRLGGSALTTVYNQLGHESADVSNPAHLKNCFFVIQDILQQKLITAGHDRSDGGLITLLCEMAFSGNCGIDIDIHEIKQSMKQSKNTTPSAHKKARTETGHSGISASELELIELLFSEELGIVIEVLPQHISQVTQLFHDKKLPCYNIGRTISEKKIQIKDNTHIILSEKMPQLRDIWESTSFALEKLQCNPTCVEQERAGLLRGRSGPNYKITYTITPTPADILQSITKHRMAVIRQEGSNGDRELLAAFYTAGLEVWDVNMQDLLNNKANLSQFKGIAFCGGFSYADVNDSAKGWAGVIKFNPSLLHQFETFRTRKDTFSLGICNGCQLMALLGWVPFGPQDVSEEEQPRFIHNNSGRFESRFTTVQIQESPAVLLQGMVGTSLGVWLAHGEGKLHVPNTKHMDIILSQHLAPIRYVDDDNHITMEYPMNPNGSPHGIASVCSQDGRHLAMMPHPERCFLPWQNPYMPNDWKEALSMGPWLKLFQNARIFCEKH